MGFLDDLPNISPLFQGREELANALLGALAKINTDDGSPTPLSVALEEFNALSQKLNIDVSGLTVKLPSALKTIENLPSDLFDSIDSIQKDFNDARKFLEDSELRHAIADGADLQTVALAVIDDVLALFKTRLGDFAKQLIDPALVAQITSAFQAMEDFKANFAGKKAGFETFASDFLIGNPLDLLKSPQDFLNKLYADFDALTDDNLKSLLGQAQTALVDALKALQDQLQKPFDGAVDAAYKTLDDLILVVDSALHTLLDAATKLYGTVQTAVDSSIWDTLFLTYSQALDSLPLTRPPSLNDMVDTIANALDGIIGKFNAGLTPAELQKRMGALTQTLHNSLVKSAMWQTRQMLIDFLAKIQHAIEGIPLEQVRDKVQAAMTTAHQKLDELGVTNIAQTIADAFKNAQDFITAQINDNLIATISAGMDQVIAEMNKLPIDNLLNQISAGVQTVQEVIDKVDKALSDKIAEVNTLLEKLDGLSYAPVSNEVIGEINKVKQKLQAMRPDALSSAQKLAIKAALAVLEDVKLEDVVETEIKKGYHAAEGEIKKLLDALTEKLKEFKDKIDIFDPKTLLAPVNEVFAKANAELEKINGRLLAKPLFAQFDKVSGLLEHLSPGNLLQPLEAPYQTLIGFADRLDPDKWIGSLDDLYKQLQNLLKYTDVSPLMAELDKRRSALFDDARKAMGDALDQAVKSLPTPLQASFGAVAPVLDDAATILFGGKDTDLSTVGADLAKNYKLSGVFAPLKSLFDEFVALVNAAPHEDVTAILNDIRVGLTTGLGALDPANVVSALRVIQQRLAGLTPSTLLQLPDTLSGLPALVDKALGTPVPGHEAQAQKLRDDTAKLALWATPADAASPLRDLNAAHTALVTALTKRVDALNASSANASYARVHEWVQSTLPTFLRQSDALTYQNILDGLDAMRPIKQAARLDNKMQAFLNQLVPLQDAITQSANSLFSGLRDALQMLNPLTLQDQAKAIYEAITTKMAVLDPIPLAKQLRTDIYLPLRVPLDAIAPDKIAAQLNAAFKAVSTALTDGVRALLDKIVGAVDVKLTDVRTRIQAIIQQVKDLITGTVTKVRAALDKLEDIIFVGVLERLQKLIDKLGVSFDKELNRVVQAFDAMLAAIPLKSNSPPAALPIAA